MASTKEYADYIADLLESAGSVSFKKMFGEYGFYLDGKYFALICDNKYFVKITDGGRKLLKNPVEQPPYDGAKPCFLISETDDRELMTSLATVTCKELPEPKPKKKRSTEHA